MYASKPNNDILNPNVQNPFRWATAIRIVWRMGGAGNRKYDNINV